MPKLLGLRNALSGPVDAALGQVDELNSQVVGQNLVTLRIYDPEIKTAEGFSLRAVRLEETNLGDFCADVLRCVTGADVALISGGLIRADMNKGNVTYGDILQVWPYENNICVLRASGQQILDALEWGARAMPGESPCFNQVSGLTYEIDVSIPSGCTADENNQMTGVTGQRRVKSVMVGDEPLDPQKLYTVAGAAWTLLENGDGFTSFNGAEVVSENFGLDSQLMVDYITNTLGGVIGEDYADPYGQGRIVIVGGED